MTKNISAIIVGLAILLSSTISHAQPNVILYILDDVGVDPFPNYLPNATKATLPQMEALMDSGITFDNVWSNPVCSPTRANILTGRHSFRTGVQNPNILSKLDSNEITLHEFLDSASGGVYSSCIIGKWHLNGNGQPSDYPNTCGIPHYAGNLQGSLPDFYNWNFVENGTMTPDSTYATSKYTDLAIDWIKNQSGPWFCWIAHNAPHTPYHSPPQNMHSQGSLPGTTQHINANKLKYFLALLETTDYELGRLMDSLPQNTLDNTVIIVIGDNGTPGDVIQAPFTALGAKLSVYEGGVHVPMLISGAGVTRKGVRDSSLINLADLFATIVEISGTTLPSIHDSRSFYSRFSTAGPSIRNCSYTEVSAIGNNEPGWTVRNDSFKLIHFNNGLEEFYNLISDPYEKTDLLQGTLSTAEQSAYNELVGCDPKIPVSVEGELQSNGIQVFPNPAIDFINVRLGQGAGQPYRIVDCSGRVVGAGKLIADETEVSLEGLASGIYLLDCAGEKLRIAKN